MNALIIGGSGGLSSVVAGLAMKEYRVWTVTRGFRELPKGVNPIKADRNDPGKLREALDAQNVRWDVVFDCICMNREHAEADLEILPRYTDRLVVVSTDSVYDGRYKRIPENEEGICVDEKGNTAECTYAGNKRHIEEVPLNGYLERHPEYSGHLCHRVYDLSKLKATGVRMPSVSLKEGIARTLDGPLGTYRCGP